MKTIEYSISEADAVRHLIVCDTQFTWAGVTNLTMPQMMDLQVRGWVVEGDDNGEFQLTEAGEAVVARALQHGAPKTLADAQPGGRVRLGDQAERARFEACAHAQSYRGGNILTDRDADHPDLYADPLAQLAWKIWQAALSTQPSPGGQGDALDLDRVLSLADVHAEESREDGVRLLDRGGLLAFAQDVAVALAARQPVGAPVAYLDLGAGGYMDVGTDLSDEELAVLPKGRHMLGIIGTYGVDGYKPAQAVDLGDFKALYRAYVRLLESGRDRIRDLGGTCDPVDVMEANDVDLQAARRVIDSQAVGK